MQLRVIIVISLAVVVSAKPNLRYRRDDSSTAAPDCDDGTVNGLLLQVANLLDGLLASLSNVRVDGVAGDNRDLIDLKNLLDSVRILLSSLLGGGDSSTTAEQEGLLTTLIGSLAKGIDLLDGRGSGSKAACQSGGAVSILLDNILGGVGGVTNGLGIPAVGGLLNGALGNILSLVGLLLRGVV